MDNFHSLRLSQIFDMYYSDQGINFDSNIKACNRKIAFTQVTSKTILREQVYSKLNHQLLMGVIL